MRCCCLSINITTSPHHGIQEEQTRDKQIIDYHWKNDHFWTRDKDKKKYQFRFAHHSELTSRLLLSSFID